jgi:negative regulator of sigma E activity
MRIQLDGDTMDAARRLQCNISALADGELAMADVELGCAMLATPDGQATWTEYYQIGAAMRSQYCGAELSPAFAVKFAARLAAERSVKNASDGAAQQDGAQRDDMPQNVLQRDAMQQVE